MAVSFFITGIMLYFSAAKTKYRRTARILGILFILAGVAAFLQEYKKL